MDLRQLQTLVAVSEHGTFSAAAEALSTVQSNVSAHIARLERELGTPLFDRAGGHLTEEGHAVVERALRIETELDALVADVAALRFDVVGNVRAGVIGTTARWLVPRLLDLMHERHPRVSLVIIDATSTSLEPQLGTGRLDLAVINLPLPDPDLITTPLFEEELLLFVPVVHRFAKRRNVKLADLEGEELLLPPPGTAFRGVLDGAFVQAGVSVRARAELDGMRLIASLAMTGFAPAILPASAVPNTFQAQTRPVRVVGLPRRRVGLARRRRGLPGAPARAVIEAIRDVVRAEATPAHDMRSIEADEEDE